VPAANAEWVNQELVGVLKVVDEPLFWKHIDLSLHGLMNGLDDYWDGLLVDYMREEFSFIVTVFLHDWPPSFY
jgi:hypothetical protein